MEKGCFNDANAHKAAYRQTRHPASHSTLHPHVVVVPTEPVMVVVVVAGAPVVAVAVVEVEAHCYRVQELWVVLAQTGHSCFRKHGCWKDLRDEERSRRHSVPPVAIRSLLGLFDSTQLRVSNGEAPHERFGVRESGFGRIQWLEGTSDKNAQ